MLSTRLLGLVVLKLYWAGINPWPGLQFPWCPAAGRAGAVSPCRSIFQAEGPRLGLETSAGVSEWACGEAGWGGGHHVEAGEPRHRKQENGNSERVTSRLGGRGGRETVGEGARRGLLGASCKGVRLDPQEGRRLRGLQVGQGKATWGAEGAWGAVVSAETLCGGPSVQFYSCPTTTTAVIVTAARLQSFCVRAPGLALSAQDLIIPVANRSGGLRLAMVPPPRSP